MGVLHARRAPFPASLIGRLIKPLVFRDDKPMRQETRLRRHELFSAKPTQDDLERERSRLLDAIRTFASQGPAGCTRNPHPFFGPLEPQQWAILMYKHVDHHLRTVLRLDVKYSAYPGLRYRKSPLVGSNPRAGKRRNVTACRSSSDLTLRSGTRDISSAVLGQMTPVKMTHERDTAMPSLRNPGRVAGLWYLFLIFLGPLRLIYNPLPALTSQARVGQHQKHPEPDQYRRSRRTASTFGPGGSLRTAIRKLRCQRELWHPDPGTS